MAVGSLVARAGAVCSILRNLSQEIYNCPATVYRCLIPRQMQRFGNLDMVATPLASRSVDAPSPSLRTFLADLPADEILQISEAIELDFLPTALILGTGEAPADARGHDRATEGF